MKFLLLTMLVVGCGGGGGGGSGGGGGGSAVRDAGTTVIVDAHETPTDTRTCLSGLAVLLLPTDAAVSATADNCAVFIGGGTLAISTTKGEPCHVVLDEQDGGAVLSTTLMFQPDSHCPEIFQLAGDASWSDVDAGR